MTERGCSWPLPLLRQLKLLKPWMVLEKNLLLPVGAMSWCYRAVTGVVLPLGRARLPAAPPGEAPALQA